VSSLISAFILQALVYKTVTPYSLWDRQTEKNCALQQNIVVMRSKHAFCKYSYFNGLS
jgi:hypothetical protein